MTAMTWMLILTGVSLNAAAQLLIKASTRPMTQFTVFNMQTLSGSALILFKSVPFWAGMMCYAASVCVWVVALTKAPVSTAYPMLSLGYVVVTVIAAVWLGELMTLNKVLGIALICAGVFVLTRSAL